MLAGDHVKAANDLGIPLTGVGVFYRKGYFQQRIHPDGTQEAMYPLLNPEDLPVEAVLHPDGTPLLIQVPIADRQVFLRVWRVQVGTVPVYLMDSDIEQNRDADRRLTDSLYGGGQETRICHEIILGIGGVRVLRALGIEPDVWHMNEGHVAFLTLERIREYSARGFAFDTALEAVKSNTIFTTHTPVPAGHDVFTFKLMDKYLADYYWQTGADRDKILSLGRVGDQFNMTRFAVRTSCKVNAVSQLHAEVTKELFQSWMPAIPKQDIPVKSVTNGIHTSTWLAPEMEEMLNRYFTENWLSQAADPHVWDRIRHIPDAEVWEVHLRAKRRMIGHLGLPIPEHALTVGFARRFATYKRALLIFQDLDRLQRIVNHPEHPVCFVFAGKAHPADRAGQDLIRRIAEITNMESFRGKIFLAGNYDLSIARSLVQGVDVWLNTPLKPMEASGTSGMKAAVNGVLMCSVLDGWWNEGYNGRNGWAIQGHMAASVPERNRVDGEELYRLLEDEIVPLFFRRNEQSVPGDWIAVMKESIRSIAPAFSTQRMVGEYYERLYIPMAMHGQRLRDNQLEAAARLAGFKRFIRQNWHRVEVESVDFHRKEAGMTVQARIRLGAIWHKDVKVQAVGSNGMGGIWRQDFLHVSELETGGHLYECEYPFSIDDWFRADANVRLVPVSPDFADEFELELCKWGTRWR